jgi:hypothetical protein
VNATMDSLLFSFTGELPEPKMARDLLSALFGERVTHEDSFGNTWRPGCAPDGLPDGSLHLDVIA